MILSVVSNCFLFSVYINILEVPSFCVKSLNELIRISGLNMLPEDVVSAILSLTSPLDVCAFSLVSSTFRSAAEFDVIWERFLPSDYQQLLSRLDLPLKFSTKKELFFHLCNSALIDGGRKVLPSSSPAFFLDIYIHMKISQPRLTFGFFRVADKDYICVSLFWT